MVYESNIILAIFSLFWLWLTQEILLRCITTFTRDLR